MSDHSGGADFLSLDPAQAPSRGVSVWLAGRIRDALMSGALTPGSALPSTRALAQDLGVSRGTVVAAYEELAAGGWVDTRVGAGTVVAAPGAPASVVPASRATGTPAAGTGAAARHTPGHPWRTSESEVRWDLTPGRPDLSFFPRAAWLRAEREALRTLSDSELGYPNPQGDPVLREELAGLLRRTRGMSVTGQDLIVAAGVSQATALLFEVMRRAGASRLAVEDPGSRGLHDHLRHWGLEPAPISVDAEGLVAEELGEQDGVLLTPAHQFPTGVVLGPGRRLAVLAWARERQALVIEDDYDAEHRYDRAPVSAMQALGPDLVAHVGSVSKTIAPGLRLGWLVPPPGLLPALVAHKDASDRGTPAMQQRALAVLIRDGHLARHLRGVRTRQRHRRDALLEGLGAHPHRARVHGVAAGLHLMLTLPDDQDEGWVVRRLTRAGILADPLAAHRLRPGGPGLVLGYAAHTPAVLREAGGVIGRILAGRR